MKAPGIVIIYFLSLIGPDAVRAQEWRGVTLMRSKRADVVRVLGPPRTAREHATFHDFEGGFVSVHYSTGPCKGRPEGWDVPRGTVIGIWVSPNPKARPRLADFKPDESKYKEAVEGDYLEVVTYRSREYGIAYDVYKPEGSVSLIRYSPASRYDHLRCTGPPDPDAGDEGAGWVGSRKFEAYTDAPPEDARRRLDDFATQLSVEWDATGYIVAYTGRRVSAREANRRAGCARDYLIRERGVSPSRLVRRVGGPREGFGIELWIRPSGAPAPRPVYGKPDIKEVEAGGGKRMGRGGCEL